MEKGGVFPFPSRRFISLATEQVFYFLETNRREKKRTEEKKLFSTTSFLSFSFLSFSTHTGLVSSVIMLDAVKSGDAKKLAEMMRQDPGFKVNMALVGSGNTFLHSACCGSHRSAVIPLLLAHPDIDVNAKDTSGQTPFYYACYYGNTSCAREMLKDSRVKVNEPSNDGWTPLYHAARYGSLDIIKVWIASGREMDLGTPGDVDKTDAIGVAKKNGKTEVVSLLERFKSDAAKTRSEVRKELGITGQYYLFFSID